MKKTIRLAIIASVCLWGFGSSAETYCSTKDSAMMPALMPAGQEQTPVAGDRWELEIAYHEQVAYDKKDIQDEDKKFSTVTTTEHIEGALDYRITATLLPAPQQPAGEKSLTYYIAEGVQAQIKDDFVHTCTDTTSGRNAKIEEIRKWEWHADKQGPIPLNIRLKTAAGKNNYQLTLTHQGPMDLDDHEPRPGFTIPWNYVVKEIINGRARLDCAGTIEVGSPDNYPGNVFANVPKKLLVYDDSQKELRGEHTWTGKSSELNVVSAETPGCKKPKALTDSGKTLPAKSVTKTLTWTLRKLDQ